MKRFLSSRSLIVAMLSLVCVSASQGQSPEQIAFNAARACEANDYDCRITNLTRGIEINAAVPEAYVNRGYAYLRKGMFDLAVADFTKAIELKPDLIQAYGGRASIYARQNKLDLALLDLNKIIQLAPQNANAHNDRGFVYRRMGKNELALADLDRAIQLYGDVPQAYIAYYNRGMLRCSQGCSDLALMDYNKAIELNPQYAEAYAGRANAYDNKHLLDLAFADYNKAIQLKPDFATAFNGRGWIYHQQRSLDLAIADYTTAIRLDPKYAAAYCNRGIAFAEVNEFDRAIADDTKALELDPDINDEIYRSRALAYFFMNDQQNAVRDTVAYLRRSGIKGEAAPYGIMIGYLALRKSGDADTADAFVKDWLKLLKPDAWSTEVLKFFAGKLTADELLAMANDNDKLTEAHAYIGEVLLAENDKAKAMEHFIWVRNYGNRDFVEYQLALKELRQ